MIGFVVMCLSCSTKPELEKSDTTPASYNSVSIAYLKSLYRDIPITVEENCWIEGTVVSSDREGNIYKMLYVEDSTGGIGIRLDDDRLFARFSVGSEVKVSCNSLTVGSYAGMIELGLAPTDGSRRVRNIPNELIASVIAVLPSTEHEVIPTPLTLDGLSALLLGCLVSFDDVQFVDEEVGLAWCDEGASTNRHLIDRNRNTLIVRTNGEADFADELLPALSGYIEGILTYFNGEYQLVVSDSRNVFMDQNYGKPRFPLSQN